MSRFFGQTFLVDYRINEKVEQYFKFNNINYIKTFKKDNLYEEIDGHPDIVACDLGDITVIEPETFCLMSDVLQNYSVISGNNKLECNYPKDISYNFVVTDKYVIGNIKYMDEVIKKISKDKNLKFINVKQGYARCSIIPLPNNIFITSDINIYISLKKEKIKVYYLNIEEIKLSNRYNGFLGGSCGVFEDEIVFFGSIEKTKVYEDFLQIVKANDIKYTNIFDDILVDYGSMICLHKFK